MARRRYISTNISTDVKVNTLAEKHGDFAALLYTWMIPHAEDNTTITGCPDELMYKVVPALRSRTRDDIIKALKAMCTLKLIIWDRDNSLIYFPCETFYKYQTYIKQENRITNEEQPKPAEIASDSGKYSTSAENAEEHRKTAENAVSFPPSFPLSLPPSLPPSLPHTYIDTEDMYMYPQTLDVPPNTIDKTIDSNCVHLQTDVGKHKQMLAHDRNNGEASEGNATENETPQPEQYHTSTVQKPDKDKTSTGIERKKKTGDNGFGRFWAAYPKRKAKADAEKSWGKIKPNEQLIDIILSSIDTATSSQEWQKEGGKYIPFPATWLNRQGWKDEYKEEYVKPKEEASPKYQRTVYL